MSEINLYNQLGPREYLGYLESFADQAVRTISDKLARIIGDPSVDMVVIAPGSLARSEVHLSCRDDYTILYRDGASDVATAAAATLTAKLSSILDSPVDIRLDSDPDNASRFSGHYYPERVLESVSVSGNPEILSSTRGQLANYLATAEASKPVIKSLRDRHQQHRRATRSGVAGHETLFDENSVYYRQDSNGSHLFGIKWSALRMVQTGLWLQAICVARLNQDPQIILSAPLTTADKIEYLSQLASVPSEEGTRTVRAYGSLLQLYHYQQEVYRKALALQCGQPGVLETAVLDQLKFRQDVSTLLEFCNHLGEHRAELNNHYGNL